MQCLRKKLVYFMNFVMQTTVDLDQSLNESVFFSHLVIKEQDKLGVFWKVTTMHSTIL